MLENSEFIAWANENVVMVVGHQGTGHGAYAAKKGGEEAKPADPKPEDPKADDPKPEGDASSEGGTPEAKPAGEKECTIYPGITCAEHEKIHEDAKTGSPSVEFQGWPSSFMVGPDGTVEKHTRDRVTKDCIDDLLDFQKKFKVKISWKKWNAHLDALAAGEKAAEEGRFKAAFAAYASIEKEGKKLSSLQLALPAKVEALNARVTDAFAKTRDASDDPAEKVKAIRALRGEVSAKLLKACLPVLAEIDAWLKANPAPAAVPPAK